MNTPSPRHPFKAFVAIAAAFAIAHGVCARADGHESGIAHVDVADQLPLHEACPDPDDKDPAVQL